MASWGISTQTGNREYGGWADSPFHVHQNQWKGFCQVPASCTHCRSGWRHHGNMAALAQTDAASLPLTPGEVATRPPSSSKAMSSPLLIYGKRCRSCCGCFVAASAQTKSPLARPRPHLTRPSWCGRSRSERLHSSLPGSNGGLISLSSVLILIFINLN